MSDDLYASRHTLPNETFEVRNKLTGERFSIFDSEINLRKEVEERLRLRGHWMVLRRMSADVCPNYDATSYEEHPSDCRYCMGLKYMYRDYLVKSYRRLSYDVEGQTSELRQEIGYTVGGKFIYYLDSIFMDPATLEKKLLNPTHGDFLLEIGLDEHGDPIKAYKTKQMLNIQFIHVLRDQQGRAEYFILKVATKATGR